MAVNSGWIKTRQIGSILLALLGCFLAFNSLMFPKDRWFWSDYHYVSFMLLPIGAWLISFLLYPRQDVTSRDAPKIRDS